MCRSALASAAPGSSEKEKIFNAEVAKDSQWAQRMCQFLQLLRFLCALWVRAFFSM
jgi:hypothetical protein